MEVNTRTQTEEKRIIEINDVEFYVEDLVQPLGWLRHGSIEDRLVDSTVLRRMQEAQLVRRVSKSKDHTFEHSHYEWEQVDGKCRELFDQLNEPYHRLRPKVKRKGGFGMWDESESDTARLDAIHAKALLERRNPDVEFTLDEEELNAIPTTVK